MFFVSLSKNVCFLLTRMNRLDSPYLLTRGFSKGLNIALLSHSSTILPAKTAVRELLYDFMGPLRHAARSDGKT